MQIWEHQNYRAYLKGELARRVAANSKYSLRAMAQRLGLTPSYFSAVLRGKKNLSPDTAQMVASKLGLSERESEYFCALTQLESAKNPALRQSLLSRVQFLNPKGQVQDLSVDHFRIISDWQHFAILAATELQDFEATPRNLAHAVGISQAEAEVAIDRMERLEMLERDERGVCRKTHSNPRVVSHSPNQALRNYHRQTLTKAIESLETQTPLEKVIGSETFCIDTDQLEQFRKLADEFLDKALALAKKSKRKDHVYHLGVQLFNLTHPKKSKEK